MKLPLVILHGALGSSEQFSGIRKALAPYFDIHTPDFEGHGQRTSSGDFSIDLFTDNIVQYLNEKSVSKTHIFGYSMGGYVALNLASRLPDTMGKIMTLATKFDWTPESAEREIRMLNADKILEKVPAFAETLQKRHGQEHWRGVLQKTASMMKGLGNGQGLSDTRIRNTETETLITVGSEDQMVSREESVHVANLLPKGNFKVLKGIKHPIETVETEFLKEEILGFFQSP